MFQLTRIDMQTFVSHIFGPEVKVLSHRLELFSKNASGIFGTHYCLYVDILDESNKKNEVKTQTFFLKTLPDENIHNVIMDESVFEEEVFFFNEVYQLLVKSKCEKWSPECYLARRDVLVFEDLRSRGFSLCEKNTLDDRLIRSALGVLARFHASTIIAEHRLGKKLLEVYSSAFYEKIFIDSTKLGQVTRFSIATLALIVERLGMDSSLVPKIADRAYEMIKNNTTGFSVICHGDLWKNNLLFDNAEPPNCILIDYQLIRYHSPVLDILMLLHLNTMPQFRRQMEMNLLKYYYSVLRDVIDQSGYKPNIPSYDSIAKHYLQYKLVGITYACMYQPAAYMKTNFKKNLDDSRLLKKWMLENRIDEIGSCIDNDPVYANNIKEIVYEFILEGKRI